MKNKKANKNDRFRRKCVGLIISWTDPDPISADSVITMGKVSHRNPIDRIKARAITQGNGKRIFHEMKFKWLISITGIFSYPNGQDQHETRELRATCNMNQINEASNAEYFDIRKHGSDDAYVTTEFRVECLALS